MAISVKVCDPETHPHAHGDYDPWNAPDPKRDFTLTLGFALQRANARMVRNADLRRRRNRAGERYDMPLARKITRTWARILLILLTATESVTSNAVFFFRH